jgi:hypothetical protein
MELNHELEALKIFFNTIDTDKFKAQYKLLKDNFTTESDIQKIENFIDSLVNEQMEERDKAFNDLKLRVKLIENREIIPFSYIAKNYFKKSKAWLYQRINGNKINGKPVQFTSQEVEILNIALQDIGKKIGSINIA